MTKSTLPAAGFTGTKITGVPDSVVEAFQKGKVFVCPLCQDANVVQTKTVGGIQRHVYRDHKDLKIQFDNIRKNDAGRLLIVNRWPALNTTPEPISAEKADRRVGGFGEPLPPIQVNPTKAVNFGEVPGVVLDIKVTVKVTDQKAFAAWLKSILQV